MPARRSRPGSGISPAPWAGHCTVRPCCRCPGRCSDWAWASCPACCSEGRRPCPSAHWPMATYFASPTSTRPWPTCSRIPHDRSRPAVAQPGFAGFHGGGRRASLPQPVPHGPLRGRPALAVAPAAGFADSDQAP